MRSRFGGLRTCLVVAGLAAWALLGSKTARSQPSPDPALVAKVAELRESANRHTLAGRFHAALEQLRRIERLTPRTTAAFEGSYAIALGNSAVEARTERGIPIPVTRSSVERVALLRESHTRVAAGERKADAPVRTRDVRTVWAGQLAFWGFVREGYQEYWSAHDAEPLDARIAGQAGWLEARFLDPASDAPVPPSARRAGAR